MLFMLSLSCVYTHATFGYHAAKDMLPIWEETPPIARLRFVHRIAKARTMLASAADANEESSVVAVLQNDGKGHNMYLIHMSDTPETATISACLWHEEGYNRHVALTHLREWWNQSVSHQSSCNLSFTAHTTADNLEWMWTV